MSPPGTGLPEGMLLSWYGDDFTGSSAVMDVLTAAGLPAVLFFDVPSPQQVAKFAGYRAIGIAGIARSKPPHWMVQNLPVLFRALAGFNAPILHYKVCSTFDSSPTTGSIGKAIDIAAPLLGSDWIPLIVGAPEIHRYQAFGNLFATVDGVGYRLDRHPTMSRHPATPMNEADVRVHLARQTGRGIGLVDYLAMKNGTSGAALARQRADGGEIIALDVVDDETLRACGRLIWENRDGLRFVVGSQGAEYALVAHWRAEGLIAEQTRTPTAAPAERIAVVSGSCSPETDRQIAWAADRGFEPIRIATDRAVDAAAWTSEIGRAVDAALEALGRGRDPILFTARGPDDPAIGAFNAALSASGEDRDSVNERIGAGLGVLLDRILRASTVNRCAIAGGDTSGHGALALGLYALTALAPITPGAPLCRGHSNDPAHEALEIALKGGQMGKPDFFGVLKQGGEAA